jgi:hypothetical protein
MSQRLITYHKVNGISIMKNNVEQDHVDLLFKYIKEIHYHFWTFIDWKPTIKAMKCNPKCHILISFFFKSIPKYPGNVEGVLGRYHVVYHQRFSTTKNCWKCLVLHIGFSLCLKVKFPCMKFSLNFFFLTLVKKITLTKYVQLALVECWSTTCIFNIWMLKKTNDVFAMVVNFLSTN